MSDLSREEPASPQSPLHVAAPLDAGASRFRALSVDGSNRPAHVAGAILARGYAAIGLVRPKNSLNVGSVLRAAHCYGAAMVATTGQRYTRAPTDPAKAYRHIPLVNSDSLRDLIPFDCVPVAVDLIDGARPLHNYTHPERAFYVFGPEDGTLGKAVTEWCRDVIYVPTQFCMNLAATVNVVLYDRLAKQMKSAPQFRKAA